MDGFSEHSPRCLLRIVKIYIPDKRPCFVASVQFSVSVHLSSKIPVSFKGANIKGHKYMTGEWEEGMEIIFGGMSLIQQWRGIKTKFHCFSIGKHNGKHNRHWGQASRETQIFIL